MSAPLALFRCDASPSIGGGHVSRCLALAESFLEFGWRVVFAASPQTKSTVVSFTNDAVTWCELPAKGGGLRELQQMAGGAPEVLVLDHADYDHKFERECIGWAGRIVVLDDNSGRDHDCDVLVDAGASDVELYRPHVSEHTRVCAGPRFALVRSEFQTRRAKALARHDGRAVENILISFGATDPANATAAALDALSQTKQSKTVILSSQAPHLDDVRKRASGSVRILPDADNVPDLMMDADLAIGAPSVGAYERACLGLPGILVTTADNQRGLHDLMVSGGAGLDGGNLDAGFSVRLKIMTDKLLHDPGERVRLSGAAASLVDGRGALRIFVACAGAAQARAGKRIDLRLAEATDEQWILKLQRKPETRRFARNPNIPTADEHRRWMADVIKGDRGLLVVVETGGQAAGTVRLDRRANIDALPRYEVSIAIDPDFHGQGIGGAALALVRRLQPGAAFDAFILPENAASIRLFTRAGYGHVSDNLYRSLPADPVMRNKH